jgi:hypothetical protein
MTQQERENLVVAMMPFAQLLNNWDDDCFGPRSSGNDRDRIEAGLLNADLSIEHVRALHLAVMAALVPEGHAPDPSGILAEIERLAV